MKLKTKPKEPKFSAYKMPLNINIEGNTNIGDLIEHAFERYEQLKKDKSILLDNYEYPEFEDMYDLSFINSLVIELDYFDDYYHLCIKVPLKSSFIQKAMETYNEKLKEYERWSQENKYRIEEETQRRKESAKKKKEEKRRKQIAQLEKKLKKLKNES